ncbi:BnaCnng34870D [Brassica napus]|uniref:BnaCnng34870D protein n=2 Tax=Brassica napus TaxID=3708 RepID=A0A078J5B3_BRANA|nr:BnaCnng34870D [Brassica napus]
MVILQLLLSTTVNQIGVLKSGSQIRRCFSPPTSCFDVYSKSHCIINVSLLSTTFCIESQEVYKREKKKHRGAFMQINGSPSWQLQAMVCSSLTPQLRRWFLQLLLSTTVNQIGVLKSGSQIRRCFSPPTSRFDIYSKSHCICNVSLLSTTFCIESQEVYRREKKKHRSFYANKWFPFLAVTSNDLSKIQFSYIFLNTKSDQRQARTNVVTCSEGTETKRFVLVHGGGVVGVWCWYKTITLLEKHGFQVDAVDLTGSGVSSIDTNNVTIFAHYSKPLFHFFESLKPTEKVIWVGHDFGGACIVCLMRWRCFLLKSLKLILDLFNQKLGSNDLMQQAQIFLYANGKKNPPTAADFDGSLLKKFIFNQSPPKDIALASVYIRPIPFAPVGEKLHVFYIKTMEDYAVSVPLQEAMNTN